MSVYTELNDPTPAAVEVTISNATKNEELMKGSPKRELGHVVEIVEQPPTTENRYILVSCCCGCSLATGVLLISWLEAISWCFTFGAAVFALYIYILDSTAEKVDKVNKIINTAATLAPFLMVLSLTGVYFCTKGMAASNKSDIPSAKSYMKWKRVMILWALIQCFVAEEGGVFLFGLSVYFYWVVRSYYTTLLLSVPAPLQADSNV
mmetsp:Transcript_66226/g.133419  ORF Transcript_66226/g.133419 Transcript_66226/m.133419 type:complete len:207 (-) Transcript_66226:352-972(-)